MIHTQRPSATACAEFDLWTQRMGRRIRRGSKGIALLYYRRGRPALRYVFDVADTECLEHSRDPMPWQYREEYQSAVTSWLEECFKVPGGDGLDKQLITLAVQFSDEHWHDFKTDIMLSVHDSLLDELDEDNVALRFRNAVTVSLSFVLLARCGFDLDTYFAPEDFACIGEFNTRDTVLALGNAVSESAGVILRQVEYAIKRQIRNPRQEPIPKNTAAGSEKPTAASVFAPEPEAPSTAPPEPPQEVPERLAVQEAETPVPGPVQTRQKPSAPPAPKALPEGPTADAEKPAAASVSTPESEAPSTAPSETPQEAQEQLAMQEPTRAETPVLGPLQAQQEAPTKSAPAAANFRITDDHLGEGGPKAKYAANVAAIKVLRVIKAEGRGATPEEQDVLSRYVGWGGVPDAFEPDKAEWANEYAELKSLMTEDEYASAQASTLNAHFTPPTVIKAIYEALGSMGFVSGNILEIIIPSLIQSAEIIKKCAFAV